jgi:hypothetical protein
MYFLPVSLCWIYKLREKSRGRKSYKIIVCLGLEKRAQYKIPLTFFGRKLFSHLDRWLAGTGSKTAKQAEILALANPLFNKSTAACAALMSSPVFHSWLDHLDRLHGSTLWQLKPIFGLTSHVMNNGGLRFRSRLQCLAYMISKKRGLGTTHVEAIFVTWNLYQKTVPIFFSFG